MFQIVLLIKYQDQAFSQWIREQWLRGSCPFIKLCHSGFPASTHSQLLDLEPKQFEFRVLEKPTLATNLVIPEHLSSVFFDRGYSTLFPVEDKTLTAFPHSQWRQVKEKYCPMKVFFSTIPSSALPLFLMMFPQSSSDFISWSKIGHIFLPLPSFWLSSPNNLNYVLTLLGEWPFFSFSLTTSLLALVFSYLPDTPEF